nr:hypothetical protein [Tanacetum cinerariifolium]
MDFRSFMMERVDGNFHFESEGGVGDEEGNDTSLENNKVILVGRIVANKAKNKKVSTSSKVTRKRKQTAESSRRKTRKKILKVPFKRAKLLDMDKNPLILDMHAKIETLQGQVDRLHGEYSKLVLEEKKWVNYEHTLVIIHLKFNEVIADPYPPLEVLLSKKPKYLRAKPAPLKSKLLSSKALNPTS